MACPGPDRSIFAAFIVPFAQRKQYAHDHPTCIVCAMHTPHEVVTIPAFCLRKPEIVAVVFYMSATACPRDACERSHGWAIFQFAGTEILFFIESYNLAKFGAVQFNHNLHVLDAVFRENVVSLPRSPRFVSFHG